MEFSNIFEDYSSVVEETDSCHESVCRNRRQHYDENGDDNDHDHDGKYKSKNLNAERKRREKLKSRMLELRSVVPKITNAMIITLIPSFVCLNIIINVFSSRLYKMFFFFQMNKETIITDAIDYIKELKISVTNLSNELLEMEAQTAKEPTFDVIQMHPVENMKKWGIESEVIVTRMDENKLWMKIVFEKKIGGFTKLIEAMSLHGIELINTNVITTKGAVLVTSCIEGTHGRILVAEHVQEVLANVIKLI
ncbi:putative transcription factor bHLH family [Helianthus annuus]|nr:putative transcription factor bHLH family [Helianthus annuus]KAJ0953646.1 putative transcription factor bHLH family [Helianthus annuus]